MENAHDAANVRTAWSGLCMSTLHVACLNVNIGFKYFPVWWCDDEVCLPNNTVVVFLQEWCNWKLVGLKRFQLEDIKSLKISKSQIGGKIDASSMFSSEGEEVLFSNPLSLEGQVEVISFNWHSQLVNHFKTLAANDHELKENFNGISKACYLLFQFRILLWPLQTLRLWAPHSLQNAAQQLFRVCLNLLESVKTE